MSTRPENKIIPVVIGLIQEQDLFLIAKRPKHLLIAGYWEFPGGKVEAEEDQFSALVRELKEEIAITVTDAEHLFQHHAVLQDRTLELNLWHILHYEQTPRSNEQQELRWVNAQQFDDYEFLPSNQTLLTFIKNWHKS